MKTALITLMVLLLAGTANALPYNKKMSSMPASTRAKLNSSSDDTKSLYERQIRKEARELESVLISTMVEPMFPEGEDGEIYGGGHGSSIYKTMMVEEYGRILSQSNSLGVADNIAENLMKK